MTPEALRARYCMGVGYPIDLVVCVALGVDMFDCVYPARTARFGVALSDEGNMQVLSLLTLLAQEVRALTSTSSAQEQKVQGRHGAARGRLLLRHVRVVFARFSSLRRRQGADGRKAADHTQHRIHDAARQPHAPSNPLRHVSPIRPRFLHQVVCSGTPPGRLAAQH